MTRADFFKRFKHGINVGNALECYEPFDRAHHEDTKMTVERNVVDPDGNPHDFKIHIDYWDNTSKDFYNWEEIWHNPMLTQKFFDFLREDGYDHVRLTVNINRHFLNNKTQEIDPLWISHIRDIITMINKAGLPVILTSQNDFVDLEVSSLSFQSFIDEDYVGKDNTARALKIWEILANSLNDFSNDDLMFDLISEMCFFDITWSDNDKACKILKGLFKRMVETVRSTGGNNSTRLLVISGHHAEFDKSRPFIETFNEDFDENCILGFVFYVPWEFTIVDKRMEWGSEEDLKEFNDHIDNFQQAFEDGVPFFIHEYAAGVANDNNSKKNLFDTCNWIYLATKRLAEIGIPMTYWDPGSLINRDTLEYKIPFFRSMIKAALAGEDFDIQKAIDENPFDLYEWWEK